MMASNVDGLVRQYAELITQDATGVIAERDRRSLHAFTRRMVDKYIVADHLNRMMDALTWAATTPNARLIITMPPRFGKSLTMSENFPAWYLGQFPDNRIIAASHTAGLAYTFSRRVRNKIADPRYPFPDVRIAEDKGAVQAWDISGRNGGYYSVGVGGSPTGIGANCFVAGTKVMTNRGMIDIEAISRGDVVASFNHESGVIEYEPVEATRITEQGDIWELRTRDGKRIRATGSHRVFVEGQGYREIRRIGRGDRVIGLRSLQAGVRTSDVRGQESGASEDIGDILFQGVFPDVPQYGGANKVLSGVQRTGSENTGEILFGYMSEDRSGPASAGTDEDVRDVQNGVPSNGEDVAILQRGLQERRSCTVDGREEERQLPWEERPVRGTVLEDAPVDSGEGRPSVRGVRRHANGRGIEEDSCPPYRRGRSERCPDQHDHALSEVPSSITCGVDIVESVVRVSDVPVPVYDIQVARNRNFFAGQILVHNCILIDDPLRSASDAASPIVRESIKEWYRETLRTRLEPGGSIVITSTRWHSDDLTGYLLDEADKGGEQWRHLHLPAIDDHGHSLWPERWSVEDLLRIKASVGSHGWEAQYQGRPVPQEGGTLKEHWFGTYLKHEHYLEIITAWDTAFKTGSANDMSAAVSVGIGSGGLDVLDVFASRLEFPDLERAVQDVHLALSSRFPRSVITTLIEDKGSGQSLIQTIRRKPYNTMNIIEVPAARTDEKLRRVNEISPIVESGRVRLPDTASWKQDALTEWTTFPFARHDDRTDAFAMAVARAAGLTGVHDEVQDVSAFAPVTTIRRRRK